jgi:hypothetical protein
MKRNCDICGTEISFLAGICSKCGMSYLAENFPNDTQYDFPRWGKLTIDLAWLNDSQRDQVFNEVCTIWHNLEDITSQKLFSNQFNAQTTPTQRLDLYGPFSSFVEIQNGLTKFQFTNIPIKFKDISLEEIIRLREEGIQPKA